MDGERKPVLSGIIVTLSYCGMENCFFKRVLKNIRTVWTDCPDDLEAVVK